MNVNFAKKFEGIDTKSINDISEGYNALFGEISTKDKLKINFDLLIPFPVDLYPEGVNPFNPACGERLEELTESIRKLGILEPITIRKSTRMPGKFEILAGHNRVKIAKSVGYTECACNIVEVDDAQATDIFVDTNTLHRTLSIKELAFAYHMKLTNTNKQGQRTDLNGQEKYNSIDTLANTEKTSKTTISRTARLVKLIPQLLDAADRKEIAFMVAYNLSFLSEENQQTFYECWQVEKPKITKELTQTIKEMAEKQSLTETEIDNLLF